MCRKVDRNARPDPLASALLKCYPCSTKCGVTVMGSADEHEKTCIQCVTLHLVDRDAANKMLTISLKAEQSRVRALEARVEAFQDAERMREWTGRLAQVDVRVARVRGRRTDVASDDDETVDEEESSDPDSEWDALQEAQQIP